MSSDIFLVSHFHWDREWYRTFNEFRARLVDAIDAVLDLGDADPGFRFLLDGQTIVLEDYSAIRPQNRERLRAGIMSGRLGAGPWYVQPDSLLPAGETHVRNLLRGRRVGEAFGAVSRVAYVPDSFGHPAQFPQLFAGFGLDPFVYWRGNGTEIDTLAPCYQWRAPDGTAMRAWYLAEGYFGAGGLDADGDVTVTADRVQAVIDRLAAPGVGPVLLMNGFDHLPPDSTTGEVAAKVGARRVLLDEAAAALPDASTLPEFAGALTGGRTTNLLPGVWSSRIRLKLRNRAVETLLTAWAEPWNALGYVFGITDETTAIDSAWGTLLENQAHDSIGGCSVDPVHQRMETRYDDAEGLGRATVTRVLERLAGRDLVRNTPWSETQELVVFNATPTTRSDVVRIPLEGFPPWRLSVGRFDFHPFSMPALRGVEVNGEPARVIPSTDPTRVRFLPGVGGLDVEFVARDVPAFGCRRFSLRPAGEVPDVVDGGRDIGNGEITVRAAADGTLSCAFSGRSYEGLFAIEDGIDRGDTYDADPDPPRALDIATHIERACHPSGVQRLTITREIATIGTLVVVATVAPDVPFVRAEVTLDNRTPDHRLRLRFPTGSPVDGFDAATTFDTARRSVTPPVDAATWVHPPPPTFVHQGWITANGLTIGAPGLPEAEVTPDGDVLVTLVRSVGKLARIELRTRPMPAGPEMDAPGAQTLGPVHATVTLAPTPADARAAEIGVWGVIGAPDPRLEEQRPLLELRGHATDLSTVKRAEDGNGIIVRLLNPSDAPDAAELRFGFDIDGASAAALDESPADQPLALDGRVIRIDVPAHALRTVRLHTRRR